MNFLLADQTYFSNSNDLNHTFLFNVTESKRKEGDTKSETLVLSDLLHETSERLFTS
jgi:hypothetical protein